MKNDVNTSISIIARKLTVDREALEMRLTCFGRAMQNGGTFHSFFEEEIGKLLAKNSKIIIVEVGYPKNWKKNG